MHKKTKEIYNQEIFSNICDRFDLKQEEVKILDGFENFIYEFQKAGKDYILRVSHSLHRNEAQIVAEIDWVNYLADHNVSVSRAIPSRQGELVEKVDVNGSYFLATAFEKAEGRHVKGKDINEVLFRNLGRMLGKMHALTCDYKPGVADCRRPEWDVEISELKQFIPGKEKLVHQRFAEIMTFMKSLPVKNNSYGLIHTDAHFGNMFIADGKLTLFDFDDSAYKWFISDIAIVVFYSVMRVHKELDRLDYAKFIFTNLMQGYQQEFHLEKAWLELLPEFLKLREIVLYAVVHKGFDVEDLSDPWCKWYLDGRKTKIENQIPYLDMSFKDLIA